jgi:hypothetical protein
LKQLRLSYHQQIEPAGQRIARGIHQPKVWYQQELRSLEQGSAQSLSRILTLRLDLPFWLALCWQPCSSVFAGKREEMKSALQRSPSFQWFGSANAPRLPA